MTDKNLERDGKPFSECSTESLQREYEAGMMMEAQSEHWTKENDERLKALEAELDKRGEL